MLNIERWEIEEIDHPESGKKERYTRNSPRGSVSGVPQRSTSTAYPSHKVGRHPHCTPHPVVVKRFLQSVLSFPSGGGTSVAAGFVLGAVFGFACVANALADISTRVLTIGPAGFRGSTCRSSPLASFDPAFGVRLAIVGLLCRYPTATTGRRPQN